MYIWQAGNYYFDILPLNTGCTQIILVALEHLFPNESVGFIFNGSGSFGGTCQGYTNYTGIPYNLIELDAQGLPITGCFGGISTGPGWFSIGGFSDPIIKINNVDYGFASDNDTIRMLTTDTLKIEASKIFQGADVGISNGQSGAGWTMTRSIPQDDWEITVSGQEVMNWLNDGDFIANLSVWGRTHTGGSWIEGIHFIIQVDTPVDNVPPTASVFYSPAELTNQDVAVTLEFSEKVQSLSGWQMVENDSIYTKTYAQNTTETVHFADLAGNQDSVEISITHIDKIAPVAALSYSTQNTTNQNVTATLIFSEKVESVSGWQRVSDSIYTKLYAQNTAETIHFADLAGNTNSISVSIANIDKTPPVISSITHVIQADSTALIIVTATDIWSGISGYSIGGGFESGNTFTVTQNSVYTLTVQDLAGNTVSQTYTINDIPFSNGINEVLANAIKIYPNPAKDELKIKSGELRIKNIQITDVSGRIIDNGKLTIDNSINVSHLSAGVYLIKIETDKGIITEKFVKE